MPTLASSSHAHGSSQLHGGPGSLPPGLTLLGVLYGCRHEKLRSQTAGSPAARACRQDLRRSRETGADGSLSH